MQYRGTQETQGTLEGHWDHRETQGNIGEHMGIHGHTGNSGDHRGHSGTRAIQGSIRNTGVMSERNTQCKLLKYSKLQTDMLEQQPKLPLTTLFLLP